MGIMKNLSSGLFFTALILFSNLSYSAEYKSGTGFFINNQGHIITNHHVVNGCTRFLIRGKTPLGFARLVDVDEKVDLALLKSENTPTHTASLRDTITDMQQGELLTLIGFPEESAIVGSPKTSRASLISVENVGDTNEELRFSDVARHGNSGGPLIDGSGNVVGVVKAMVTEYLNGKPASRESVAVGLSRLRMFLDRNGVNYQQFHSSNNRSALRTEDKALDYIVNVYCAVEKN
jgi:serine protease Do